MIVWEYLHVRSCPLRYWELSLTIWLPQQYYLIVILWSSRGNFLMLFVHSNLSDITNEYFSNLTVHQTLILPFVLTIEILFSKRIFLDIEV
ncbi:hypothetical protein PVK06_022479 [Gossypium arboreum]|uniref:Uncharacterized protein n=1 Tax=Gossypium arboreum TaxID=29729 RepID=A0ABR0P8Q4_GOSAR|nr:hypothetical protein PVK06_022479 [Gossypium arboreum]